MPTPTARLNRLSSCPLGRFTSSFSAPPYSSSAVFTHTNHTKITLFSTKSIALQSKIAIFQGRSAPGSILWTNEETIQWRLKNDDFPLKNEDSSIEKWRFFYWKWRLFYWKMVCVHTRFDPVPLSFSVQNPSFVNKNRHFAIKNPSFVNKNPSFFDRESIIALQKTHENRVATENPSESRFDREPMRIALRQRIHQNRVPTENPWESRFDRESIISQANGPRRAHSKPRGASCSSPQS